MRATVDLDTPAISEIIQAWDLLTQHGDGIVWGRVSSSGKGVHLEVHNVEPEKVDAIRTAAGDDRKRMWYDGVTLLKPKQIFFDRKGDKQAQEWTTSHQDVIDRYRETAPRALYRRYLQTVYPVCRVII